MKESEDVDREMNARKALLDYYSRECMTHGTFVIAIAVGFIAFWQVFLLHILSMDAIPRACMPQS